MMFQKAEYWPKMVGRIPPEAREHLPHSARVELATPAVIDAYITVIDYVPAHCTQTGCGFACWSPRA
jgi:hypothetical protein